MDPALERIRNSVHEIAARYGAGEIRVFRSRARGEHSDTSDLDLLVRFEPGRSLLDLIAFEEELSRELGLDVDVLTPASISPYLRDEILEDAIPL